MTIIPAIDIINGKCVRLTHGDYAQEKKYFDDPLEAAKIFENAGFGRLHVVDLDGAKTGKVVNMDVLKRIASGTKLRIDFGGGVKNIGDVESILGNGATMVTLGSLAAKDPATVRDWIKRFGADRFFIGADVKDRKIKISGWLEDTGQDIFGFLETAIGAGAIHFFCTDIGKDGAMQGPSVELYREILQRFPALDLTASGGVAAKNDLTALQKAGCSGAIVGKAIYEKTISLEELKSFENEK